MPSRNEYLLCYGPLALTLSTAIIDIALTTNTSSKSSKSQQGAQNFYKAIRKYNSQAISLTSTLCSGYLTYLKLTDGTYIDISDLGNKVLYEPKSVFVNEPVLLTGVALGINGINIGARLFNEASTNSLSSSKRINANKVFDILGDNVLPQLSGGLLVGFIGGAIAGVGKLAFSGNGNIIDSFAVNVLGVESGVVESLTQFSKEQLDAFSEADVIKIRASLV